MPMDKVTVRDQRSDCLTLSEQILLNCTESEKPSEEVCRAQDLDPYALSQGHVLVKLMLLKTFVAN